MQGNKEGLAALIKKDFPMALPVHCITHCLNFSSKNFNNVSKLMRNTMATTKEIGVIVKYSPKREEILEKMKIESFVESSNDGEEGGEVDLPAGRIVDTCETQWTIRHSSYESINENYSWLCALIN